MKRIRPIKRLREWLEEVVQSALHYPLEHIEDVVSGTDYYIRQMLAQQEKQNEEIRRQNVKIKQLNWFQGVVEASGVRVKFGGRIDIDFDKFVGSLDADSRAQLKKVLRKPGAPPTPRPGGNRRNAPDV